MKVLILLCLILFSCNKDDNNQVQVNKKQVAYKDWFIKSGNRELNSFVNAELEFPLKKVKHISVGEEIISSPIIVDFMVYTSTLDGSVVCYDIKLDEIIWKRKLDDSFEASPMFLDGNVYIGGISGKMYSLDSKTGEVNWVFDSLYEIKGSANYTVVKNLKYIIFGNYNGELISLNYLSGDLVWKYKADSFINGTPSIKGSMVFLGSCDSSLYVINSENGSLLKKITTDSYIPGSIAVSLNNVIFGNYNGSLICVDLENFENKWINNKMEIPLFNTPSVGANKLFSGERSGEVKCLDLSTGNIIWEKISNWSIEDSVIIVGTSVIFGTQEGEIVCIDLNTGDVIWNYNLGTPVLASPALYGDYIVFTTEDGFLYLFKSK